MDAPICPSFAAPQLHSVVTVPWVLYRIYTCLYISQRYGFRYIRIGILEGFLMDEEDK